MKNKGILQKLFGGARGCKQSDYLYSLFFNANKQSYIDNLPNEDLDVLIRLAKKNIPKECLECWFFQAYSEPISCTLGSKPEWDQVPDDCVLRY